jgi:hypothetical protein
VRPPREELDLALGGGAVDHGRGPGEAESSVAVRGQEEEALEGVLEPGLQAGVVDDVSSDPGKARVALQGPDDLRKEGGVEHQIVVDEHQRVPLGLPDGAVAGLGEAGGEGEVAGPDAGALQEAGEGLDLGLGSRVDEEELLGPAGLQEQALDAALELGGTPVGRYDRADPHGRPRS